MEKIIFVEVDLVQAEWVVTAYCSQDARMLKVVEDKLDPHVTTGMLISNAAEEIVVLDHKLVGHLTDPHDISKIRADKLAPVQNLDTIFLPRTMSIRQAGKKSNHGLNYNMGYKRFALENELDEAEARRIVGLYKDVAYPGLHNYYREVERELKERGRKLKNCFGQARTFLDKWGPDLLNAAYAFKPQSTVGNVTNNGLRRIYNDTSNLEEVNLAAQVHDSILNEHTFSSIPALANQILWVDRHMSTVCHYHGENFTLRREYKLGMTWGQDDMVDVEWSTPDELENALKAVSYKWEGN